MCGDAAGRVPGAAHAALCDHAHDPKVLARETGMIRSILRTALASPPLASACRRLSGSPAALFMLHRFSAGEPGGRGTDVAALRRGLALLRRERCHLLDLHDAASRLALGEPLPARAVVLTVDDGYADFARLAAPVFTEFDCPVTVFVTTGFVDGAAWMWWDELEYLFERTPRHAVDVDLPDGRRSIELGGAIERRRAAGELARRLEHVTTAQRIAVRDALAERLEVDVPARPAPDWEAMTWDDVRSAAARGVRFAPHTVTHPILSQTDADAVRWEIGESWRRLQQHLPGATPIFCYPNGSPWAFGAREMAACRDAGLAGGVSSVPTYLTWRGAVTKEAREPYSLPRFPWPAEPGGLEQVLSGLEGLKAALRRALVR